jgi:monothiol glutaredoxin
VDLESVQQLIEQGFEEAEVRVTGEGCSLEVTVISQEFAGLARIKQHRRVQDRVKHLLASGELHALSINTYTPEEWVVRQGS